MAEEQDLLKFKLDTTDVEARIKRMQELWAELQRRMAAGGDTGAIEQQLQREMLAMGQLGTSQKQAAVGAKDLLGQKEKLLSVIGLLGGQFGGFAGQITNVAQAFLTLGTAAGPAIAILAGITGAVAAWRSFVAELENAEKLLKRVDDAREKLTKGQATAVDQISGELKKAGALSQGNVAGAFDLYTSAMERGASKSDAARLSGGAFAAGLSAEDVALLAAANVQESEPEALRRAVAGIRGDSGRLAETRTAVEHMKGTRAGMDAAIEAEAIRRQSRADPRFFEKALGGTQDSALFEKAVQAGLLKPDANINRVDELRREYSDLVNRRDRGGLSKADLTRLEALSIIPDYSEALDAMGNFDTTGEIRTALPEQNGPTRPMRRRSSSQPYAPFSSPGHVTNIHIGQVYTPHAPQVATRRIGGGDEERGDLA